jgi:hypothetical protein
MPQHRPPPPLEALLVEQARLLARHLQDAADAAPDGQVLARVEALVLTAGREFLRRAAEAALQGQAAAAEKRGRRGGPAPAAGGSATAAAPPAGS